ncbi:UNVERIFIED_CONTAM: hypothetical protein Scaly_2746300 [Sesamum calycinum]|uniref:Transposase MuDR plant domain-containing protein n=1 Tax=Sesamum calycinum TaxID=2727403 RepID=A0AAW2J1U0_9LAMI
MYELGIMYEQCGGKKGTMNFYYKVPGLPLELGLRRINNECPDICICDLENQYRGLDLPIEIYVEEMDCEPIQALDQEGNVVSTQQEEEMRLDKGKRKISYAENQSSSEFDDSSDEDYLQSNEASTDSETPSLVLEDLEVSSDEDIFLNKNPSKRDLMHKLRRVMKKRVKKTEKQPEVEVNENWFSDDGENDELESLHGSDNEDSLPKHEFFSESTNIKTCQLKVGMKFHDAKHFRETLRDWCIRGGFDIEYVKNEKVRVTAKCKIEGCNWRIHASPVMNDCFQIKSIQGAHTCARTYNNKLAKASYLAKRMNLQLETILTFQFCS